MDRDTAVSRIQEGLGFRSDLVSNIILALQEAQALLEMGRTLPDFLIQRRQTFTIAEGTDVVTIPTGFLRLYEEPDGSGAVFVLDQDDSSYYALTKKTAGNALLNYNGADPGKPQIYVLDNKASMYVYPERDADYDGVWGYYKTATSLATNVSDNAWLVYNPNALIGRAGMMLAQSLGNQRAFQKFQELYTNAWASGFADDIQMGEVDEPIFMGESL